MPIIVALALYGGAFVGYVLGDTQAFKRMTQETSPSMEQLAEESQQMIQELR